MPEHEKPAARMDDARVVAHRHRHGEYRELVLAAPDISPRVIAGQFVHLRVPRFEHRLLRRPFSVYRAGGETLSILYKTVGEGTRALADIREGETVSLIGPLGTAFPDPAEGSMPVLVAGGYGVAPLSLFAARTGRRCKVFIGAASEPDVLCVKDFEDLDCDVRVTTEDGSMGETGLVTVALDAWLDSLEDGQTPAFYACGPDGLLKAVGDRAIAGNWQGWLSLDKHMGCGMGACLACVQRLRKPDGGEVWARVCKEGPVFESREIVW